MQQPAAGRARIDIVQRFAVEQQSVRGQFVRLGPAWLALREHGDYPEPVRRMLGEAVTAAVLLASTLKFQGELTLQLQGDGAVRLLVAQCTNDFRIRAVARFDRERVEASLRDTAALADPFAVLAGAGTLVVTVEADRLASRYQGVVPISGGSLAASLEHYFETSEQLPTAVVLGADDFGTAGLLVQRMPDHGGIVTASVDTANQTFAAARAAIGGVQRDELLARPPEDLMRRAFNGLDLRVHDSHPVGFRCRCSRERVSGMLRSLGLEEVRSIIAEQQSVTVTCEFCHRPWRFDPVDALRLFGAAVDQVPGSTTLN
ncbi:MAG: Hsp33 family molecular chaperone HslO [Gammaproteobacteria bacterium]